MRRFFTYTIEEEEYIDKTLGEFLRQMGWSRRLISQLKSLDGSMKVNHQKAFTNCLLETGDLVEILLPEDGRLSADPEAMNLRILYEDQDLLVIDKDPGIAVHPSITHHQGTLANGLSHYLLSKGEPAAFHCINRLDRDTSGLLIVAKHRLSASILSRQMRERKIHRTYQAIVCGQPDPAAGILSLPIGRAADSILLRQIDPQGDPAITHYRTLSSWKREEQTLSLLELILETGRTHQIRVHMTAIGCPLPGDFLYNPEDRRMSRQALHGCRLSFYHPSSGKEMTFFSPLPPDMKALLSPCMDPP